MAQMIPILRGTRCSPLSIGRVELLQHLSVDLLQKRGDQVVAKNPVDDTHVEISCPQCAHTTEQPIDWICDHWELACGGCGIAIPVDRGAFRKAIEDVRQRLNEARSRIIVR
jgi:hypothetical protein